MYIVHPLAVYTTHSSFQHHQECFSFLLQTSPSNTAATISKVHAPLQHYTIKKPFSKNKAWESPYSMPGKTDPASSSSSSHMGVYKLRAKVHHKYYTRSARGVNGNHFGSVSYAIGEEPMVSVPTDHICHHQVDRNTDSKRHIQPQEGGKHVLGRNHKTWAQIQRPLRK